MATVNPWKLLQFHFLPHLPPTPGDAIGFDQAEVTAIKKNEIHLELGYELIRLRRPPGENTFIMMERDSGD